MTPAKLRLVQAAMAERDTKVGELCKELGVTRQTLYRLVDPKGELRPDGAKLLERKPSSSVLVKKLRIRLPFDTPSDEAQHECSAGRRRRLTGCGARTI
jgi:hypothetical protein